MSYIELKDYFILPFYLIFFTVITAFIAKKKVAPELIRYFFMAFFLRMLGSILYAMVHQYYYGYGDTFGFYRGGQFITDQIGKDFSNVRYFFASMENVGEWYRNSPEAD